MCGFLLVDSGPEPLQAREIAMIELPRRIAVTYKSPITYRRERGEAFAYRAASDNAVTSIYSVQDVQTGRVFELPESDLSFE
jgi:hypothetical protein